MTRRPPECLLAKEHCFHPIDIVTATCCHCGMEITVEINVPAPADAQHGSYLKYIDSVSRATPQI